MFQSCSMSEKDKFNSTSASGWKPDGKHLNGNPSHLRNRNSLERYSKFGAQSTFTGEMKEPKRISNLNFFIFSNLSKANFFFRIGR